MKKVIKSRKVKIKEFLYMLSLAIGVGLSCPIIASAADADTVIVADDATEGEDLFVDETDDAKTEDIKETDIVENNVVVEEEKKEETTSSTESKSTESTETKEDTTDKSNDGGSCVTPENNYTEGEGEYWDPSIKTEEEKKGINQDTPTPDTPTPDTPTPDTPTPDTPTPDTPTPDTPTPDTPTPDTPTPDTPTPDTPEDTPTPKTGVEVDWLRLLGAAGLVLGGGVGFVGAALKKEEETKIKKR